jgi:hypothetical protein
MNRILTIAFLFLSTWVIAQPSITSFSPTQAEVGESITITGTNFSITSNDNIVYFGGVRATVTNATTTQLTVLVPNGSTRDFISVTRGGLTAFSRMKFNIINSGTASIAGAYSLGASITVSSVATTTSGLQNSYPGFDVIVGAADFDGDGWPDVFKAGNGAVGVNRNLLTGTTSTIAVNQFSASSNYTVTGDVRTIVTSDIDSDGKLDIITGSSSGISILRNTSTLGTISFAAAVNIVTATTNIRVADFDLDGKLDIAAVNNGNLNIFKNTTTSSITFNSAVAIALSTTGFNGIDIGDLNNDGKIDIVVTKGGVTNVVVNNSTSNSLSLSNAFTINEGNVYLIVDDIDKDGKVDLYFYNRFFKNNYSTGSIASSNFTGFTNSLVDEGGLGISAPDINADGYPEIILGSWWSHYWIYRNAGTGVSASIFSSRQSNGTGGNAMGVDLNGDQKIDVISSNHGGTTGNANFRINQNTMAPSSGLTATCSFVTFGQCAANTNPSANQTITISGSSLTADIVIGAATNFEYSLDNVTYSSTLTIPFGTGTVAATTVYVRYNRIDLGSDRVNIPISSSIAAGARKLIIAATGVRVLPAISGAATVCSGSNSTVLTLSGHTGTVTRWESSTNNFATTGTSISNPTTTLTATNLTVTTYYRAVLAGGSCGAINTDAVMITVNTSTIGGTLTIFNGTSQLTGSGIADATTPWTSSDISVATISNTGLVTAISGGTSTITYKENTGCTVTAIFTVTMPKITVSAAALNAFTTCAGTVSGNQSFTVSGINLTANIIITPPVGFEISSTSATAGYNTTSLTLTRTGGTVNTTTIFVRTTTSATGTPSGNVSMNSTGVTQIDKAVSATINDLPTIGGTITIFNGTSQLTGSGIADATTPWTSSNTSVATISNTGLVTAIAGGTSTITYRVNTGCTITALFTVTMPTITVSAPALTAFTGCTGFNSTTQSFTVSGINLTSDIIITTPTGFEISSTSATAGYNATSLTLTQTSGNVPNTTIHVRTTTASTGTPSGNVSMNSTGVTQIDKAVSATINITPTISGILTKQRAETSQLTGSGTPRVTTPWASSNTAVATVSNTGLVTAVGAGTCIITYFVSSGCSMTATFTTTPITIYANSISGNDANNGLSQLTAKKTFTAAFTTAAAGDIIDLTGTFTWGDVGETTAAITGFTITKSMTIRGQGADQTIIQANALPNTANRKVFTINANVTVVLENLTIQHGRVANLDNSVWPADGGGIYNSGTLTLNFCRITKNTAIAGTSYSGGIGGGIYHLAINTMRINGCTFDNNEANGGGALGNEFGYSSSCNFIITNSTFAYNKSGTGGTVWVGGGAIRFAQGTNNITNSTFAYNSIDLGVGASIQVRLGDVKLKNSIFVNGTKGGQPLPGGSHEITVSQGSATDEGNNIFGPTTGITFNASSWQPSSGGGYQNVGDNTKKCVLNVEAILGSNGATNGTVSLKTTGLNIEEGSTVANNGISIPTVDQRGLTRVGTPDIGAYEYTDIEPFVTCFSPSTGAAGTSVAIKGINLTGASSVKFNTVEASSYTVNSGVSITAIAPQSTTGLISVTTNLATANSTSNYIYPPLIERTGTLTAFTKCSGSPSAAQSFTVSGSNMTAAISIAALTGFEYCLTVGGTYTTTLTVGAAGTIASTTVFVRMQSGANTATYAANNIVLSSSGATSVNVSVSGTVNTNATISTQPSTSAATYCSSAIATALSVTAGSTVNLTYQWYSRTTSGNTGGTLIGGAYSNTYIPSTSTAGVLFYYCVITNPCGSLSSNSSGAITVNASVGGSISGSTTVCSGTNSTILTLSGHTGSVTRWESSLDNFATAGTTIANTTTTLTATNLNTTTSYRALVTNGSCTAANSASATLTVNFNNTWTGNTNNLWNTATNWSCGVVPTANHNVIISSGNPIMDVDFTNPSGKTLTISGSGTLTINAGRTLTIAGTTDFDGKLVTLKSDATGTAAIGTITGTLSNASNVTVERFIPANGRRYRFLSSPVVGGTTLQWRDNAGSTAGRGTHITGPIGTNDVSTTPQASAFKYTESLSSATNINECWEAIDGNTNLINGTGYRVFIRGDRTIDITTTVNSTNNATTLWVNGAYPTGTITLPVSYTAGKGDGWNLVGNPYPCTIDYEASSGWGKTNMGNGVAIFRPSSNSYAYSLSSGGANPSNLTINGGSQYIASGQAFFVKANGAGIPALTCTEAVKVTNQGSPINLFKGVPANQLRLTLIQDSSNIDETLIAFAANYKDAFDNNEDITKIPNANVNISTVVGTEKYAAINLTSNNYKEKVMPLSVWSNKNGDLQLSFSQLAGFDAGVTVFLKDKFLNTTTPIEQDKKININLNDISKGDNRFELIFKNSASNIEQVLFSNAQLSVYPNPATNLLNVNISNAIFKNSIVSIYNVSGQQLMNSTMNGTNTALNIESLSNGIYFINVTNENGFNKTVKFVK